MNWWRYKKKPGDKDTLIGLGILFISFLLLPIVVLVVGILFPRFWEGGEKWMTFIIFSIGTFLMMLGLIILIIKENLLKRKLVAVISSFIFYFVYISCFLFLCKLRFFNPPQRAITNVAIFAGFFLLLFFLFVFEEKHLKKIYKKGKK